MKIRPEVSFISSVGQFVCCYMARYTLHIDLDARFVSAGQALNPLTTDRQTHIIPQMATG
ncbi:MAG: hypothetical protein OEU97_01020 [Dehalococcoidia bacterium]|nr:hypothetical protein [Dehalococcoidia bacterium]MDH4299683.1 hypothetical protein [Dehalococcoidia bacterium]MDH4366989.1 hypothetical protein [Dehalococcoidia bacterium]